MTGKNKSQLACPHELKFMQHFQTDPMRETLKFLAEIGILKNCEILGGRNGKKLNEENTDYTENVSVEKSVNSKIMSHAFVNDLVFCKIEVQLKFTLRAEALFSTGHSYGAHCLKSGASNWGNVLSACMVVFLLWPFENSTRTSLTRPFRLAVESNTCGHGAHSPQHSARTQRHAYRVSGPFSLSFEKGRWRMSMRIKFQS